MPEAGRPRGCLREALPSRVSPSMCLQPAGSEVGMNFGVVFAFILSLPLARLEVSFRRRQRAVLPSCEPRSRGGGDRRRRFPPRRCGGVKPGGGGGGERSLAAGGEEPGRAAAPLPLSEGRAAQGRGPANGGQSRPPPALRGSERWGRSPASLPPPARPQDGPRRGASAWK